jgi:hypothetical protein
MVREYICGPLAGEPPSLAPAGRMNSGGGPQQRSAGAARERDPERSLQRIRASSLPGGIVPPASNHRRPLSATWPQGRRTVCRFRPKTEGLRRAARLMPHSDSRPPSGGRGSHNIPSGGGTVRPTGQAVTIIWGCEKPVRKTRFHRPPQRTAKEKAGTRIVPAKRCTTTCYETAQSTPRPLHARHLDRKGPCVGGVTPLLVRRGRCSGLKRGNVEGHLHS